MGRLPALIALVLVGILGLACLKIESVLAEEEDETEQPICTLEVINPTCGNGSQTPEDADLPCIPWNFCSNLTNGVVDCQSWICSLRANCGCFAGQVTSCAANATSCNKGGCKQVVDMFTQSDCDFADFLGPRDNTSLFNTYLNECLAGCNGSIVSSASLFALAIIFIGCLFVSGG